MVERFRHFFATGYGKIVVIVCVGLLLVWVARSVMFELSPSSPLSGSAIFIDAKTGKPFDFNPSYEAIPVLAPSGERTGYPASMCWWTKDGKKRDEPYPVLMNRYAGKSGATYCPECDRLVEENAVEPLAGDSAPLLQSQAGVSATNRTD